MKIDVTYTREEIEELVRKDLQERFRNVGPHRIDSLAVEATISATLEVQKDRHPAD